MNWKLGNLVRQQKGYQAFIPAPFPPKEPLELDASIQQLHSKAMLVLGKLDGITQLLPDLDFFIFMYIRKEAALSSQIEGTKATFADAIIAETKPPHELPADVDDILHYIKAMNFGLQRLEKLPLSLRLIREVHRELLEGARSDHYAAPGDFRESQNWIGGTRPDVAHYVPPPPHEMREALADFEKFLHEKDDLLPLVKAALAHSQFELIHPFLDGNGRTGRLLVTFYLCQQGLLDRPVLYLSSYLKKHRDVYFELLDTYRRGDVVAWIRFFLEGVFEVATEATQVSKKITELRQRDMEKIQTLGARTAGTALKFLRELYKFPIVNVATVEQWTGYSRPGANQLVRRFIELGILQPQSPRKKYGRTFEYSDYLKLFR